MKKSFGIFLLLSLFCLLIACGGEDASKKVKKNQIDPEVVEELKYYAEELDRISPIADEVYEKFEVLRGNPNNIIFDIALYATLKTELIPQYTNYVTELAGINLDTDELREIYELDIEAANLQHAAYIEMLAVLEAQDHSMVNEINDMISESSKLEREAMNKYNDLSKVAGLELKRKYK